MLDALNAIGIAGNIVFFVDFASKLLSTSHKLYKSSNGPTARNIDLYSVTEDLQKFCTEFREAEQTPHLEQRSQDDPTTKLSHECNKLASDLLGVLQSVLVENGNRKWNSFRAAIKLKWKETHINEVETRLRNFREQILLRLTSSIK